jgi:ATP-dependent DNA helicase RecQ
MKDQVSSASGAGIEAAFINSSMTYDEYVSTMRDAYYDKYKIIYAAPERLTTETFLRFSAKKYISLIAVDEAHCISQWGHDFRPSYLKITEFIEKLPRRPIVSAFTATATPIIKNDIATILKLKNPYINVTGFDRANLYFEVRRPFDKYEELEKIVAARKNKCGIVYCLTRKSVDEVYTNLNKHGFAATRYHAGLSDIERHENQDDFIYDRKLIMVATNAFGMGIDKSNVSYVVHHGMPKSVENYYQEAGRAGRDGNNADCILLFGVKDVYTNQYLIDNNELNRDETHNGEIHKSNDYERLKQMTDYATTTACLRRYILNYFGDKNSVTDNCGNCSNCKTAAFISETQNKSGEISRKQEFAISETLYKTLAEIRKELSNRIGVPAYSLFTDVNLRDMCKYLPTNDEDMNKLPGIGTYKLSRYGKRFTDAINDFITKDKQSSVTASVNEWNTDEDKKLADEYYDGMTIKDIAERHGRNVKEINKRIEYLHLEWNF